MPSEPSKEPSVPPPPENPQLLLAELEAARLALRSRPAPSRGRRLAVGILVLLLLGALALWGLSLLQTVRNGKAAEGSVKNSVAPGKACT